jgi:hypothetical protein
MSGMSYEEKEMVLDAGDSALFYSDGLVEVHDPKGEMFGFARLRELIGEHGEESSLEDLLLEELYYFVGEGWQQEDDITLLTLRCSAPQAELRRTSSTRSSQDLPSRHFGEQGFLRSAGTPRMASYVSDVTAHRTREATR